MFPTIHGILSASTSAPESAVYNVVTTGAATHTINSLGLAEPTLVDWGDGSSSTLSGTALRTHNYASAGTWTVTIPNAQNVIAFDMRDNKAAINTATLPIINVVTFTAVGLSPLSSINTNDMASWSPTTWQLYSMPAGGTYNIDTSHMSTWSPTSWYCYSMPAGGTYNIDTSHMVSWSPSTWYCLNMPAGGTYNIDTSHMSTWSPAFWQCYSMPVGGTYNIDTSHMSTWSPTYWLCYSMPAGGTYNIDTADMVSWSPTFWYCHSMPVGGTYNIDTSHMSTWSPSLWYCHSMPAGAVTNVSTDGFSNFTKCTQVIFYSNGLLQPDVDTALWSIYRATAAPRTVSGGIINVGGTNAAPSGIYQPAASCPVTVATPGKEIAYELTNDSCAVGFNKWTTVTTA